MQDFNIARTNMVDCQIRTCDVTNHELLNALLEVPRERFIPKDLAEMAYVDEDVKVGDERYVMEPAPFAKLVQAASIKPGDVVLDVGCATGYSAAVLSKLASLVIALEEDEAMAASAAKTLDELDYDNVAVVQSTLNDGFADEGPYDVIFVGGAVDAVPQVLFDQLKDHGKLIAVEGEGNAAIARIHVRNGEDVSGRNLFNCAIKPLPGFQKEAEFVL